MSKQYSKARYQWLDNNQIHNKDSIINYLL